MQSRWRLALAVVAGAALIVSPVTAARDGADGAPKKPKAAMKAAPPLERKQIVPMLMPRWGKGPTEADIVDPQMTVVEETDLGDHIRRRLSYYVEKGEKVYGYLLLPKDRGSKKLPLVMCPHPTSRTGKDMVVGKYDGSPVTKQEALKRTFRSYGLDLVRRGYICFAPDAPGFGERAPFPKDPGWQSNMKGYQAQLTKRWPTWQYTPNACGTFSAHSTPW